MSVLDERTGVAIEVDTLLGVEEHVLAGVDLQDEILQGSHTHDACNLVFLVIADAFYFVHLVLAHLSGIANHRGYQVVSVHHGSFAALHLSVRQFHHSVAEVNQFLAPLEAQSIEQQREHLEMVVLLVAHHIYHLVNRIVLETHLRRSDVLSHID